MSVLIIAINDAKNQEVFGSYAYDLVRNICISYSWKLGAVPHQSDCDLNYLTHAPFDGLSRCALYATLDRDKATLLKLTINDPGRVVKVTSDMGLITRSDHRLKDALIMYLTEKVIK